MSLIVFSHGNSFPAATYNVLYKNLRSRGFVVKPVDKFGHDPDYPVTNNWPHLVAQLAAFDSSTCATKRRSPNGMSRCSTTMSPIARMRSTASAS